MPRCKSISYEKLIEVHKKLYAGRFNWPKNKPGYISYAVFTDEPAIVADAKQARKQGIMYSGYMWFPIPKEFLKD